MSSIARVVLQMVVACMLLLLGFAALVAGMFSLADETGRIDPGSASPTLVVATTYFRVVFFKGLLPQLVLSLALWPLAERLVPSTRRAWRRRVIALTLAGFVAWLVVAPLLLVTDLPGWPAFQMPTIADCIGTTVLSVIAVVGAGWAAHVIVYADLWRRLSGRLSERPG